MYYLPEEFINQNYRYSITDDYITIRTNNNCYTNYNNTYCDCYNIYPKMDYMKTDAYSCNYNSSTNISYTNYSSDFWYRQDLSNILIIFTILFIFIILFPYKIVARMFGRWLKI